MIEKRGYNEDQHGWVKDVLIKRPINEITVYDEETDMYYTKLVEFDWEGQD